MDRSFPIQETFKIMRLDHSCKEGKHLVMLLQYFLLTRGGVGGERDVSVVPKMECFLYTDSF